MELTTGLSKREFAALLCLVALIDKGSLVPASEMIEINVTAAYRYADAWLQQSELTDEIDEENDASGLPDLDEFLDPKEL